MWMARPLQVGVNFLDLPLPVWDGWQIAGCGFLPVVPPERVAERTAQGNECA